MTDDELEDVLYWLGDAIREARQALWDGKSGKAFANIEAAEGEFEKLEEMIEAADTGTEPEGSVDE